VIDWARDGRHFLTNRVKRNSDGSLSSGRIFLMNRDGTEQQAITDGTQPVIKAKLSLDGSRLLCEMQNLVLVEVSTGKAAPVEGIPPKTSLRGFCWSPDGDRIAYITREDPQVKPGVIIETEIGSHLVVCHPDGKNSKVIASSKSKELFCRPTHVAISDQNGGITKTVPVEEFSSLYVISDDYIDWQ
jgi:Tol biopolymer transport system component